MKPIEQRTVLVTGATDGLGRALAHDLAASGATVLLHGRDEARGRRTLDQIRDETGNDQLRFYRADFSVLSDVVALADQLVTQEPRLDVLVNNAGLGVDPVHRRSADGHELTFQVDYLAPYILSYRLAPLLIIAATPADPARIVTVTSAGQAPIDFDDVMLEHAYDGVQAYCQAKHAEVMLTLDLATALADEHVTANCLHPASYMPTKIVVGLFTPQSGIADGVRNTLHLITDPDLDHSSGYYYNQARQARGLDQAYDPAARARLRQLAERLTGVPADIGQPVT